MKIYLLLALALGATLAQPSALAAAAKCEASADRELTRIGLGTLTKPTPGTERSASEPANSKPWILLQSPVGSSSAQFFPRGNPDRPAPFSDSPTLELSRLDVAGQPLRLAISWDRQCRPLELKAWGLMFFPQTEWSANGKICKPGKLDFSGPGGAWQSQLCANFWPATPLPVRQSTKAPTETSK